MAKAASLIIPLYNENESLHELYQSLKQLEKDSVDIKEIIFVNDGSTDGSLRILKQLAKKDKQVRVISFKRNFGKGMILNHAFKKAEGEIIVTLDADLQDGVENIPKLLEKIEEGFDLVIGWKKQRSDKASKVITSRIFNLLISLISGFQLHDYNSGLKAIRKEALLKLDASGGRYRFIPLILHKQGFRVCEVPVKHYPRKYGKSRYGPSRFITALADLVWIFLERKENHSPSYLPKDKIDFES